MVGAPWKLKKIVFIFYQPGKEATKDSTHRGTLQKEDATGNPQFTLEPLISTLLLSHLDDTGHQVS